jgi:hypothetical protein
MERFEGRGWRDGAIRNVAGQALTSRQREKQTCQNDRNDQTSALDADFP